MAVTRPLTIWILGDGKPGHENQSLGLAEAIGRRLGCETHRIAASPWRDALATAWSLPPPDLIVAAGHSTHGMLAWLKRGFRARTVVLMRPSLPTCFFDMVIAPEHDFKKPPPLGGRVLATKGAINRVVPAKDAGKQGALVLLGGPSKHHGWDADAMRAMLAEIAGRTPHLEAADSRRTPEGFFESLDFIQTQHRHQDTPPGWLAGRLATADEVWVTEDSVSMVYEALSGGAKVGVLPVPRLRADARIIKGLDRLLAEGWATRFEDWKAGGALKSPPAPLAEADRAAKWVLDHLTKEDS
jgi:mitochondrial fission protein ELM1